jgi:hypothetical protein
VRSLSRPEHDDAEGDPRPLEDEEPDVVHPHRVEEERHDESGHRDDRNHPSAPERGAKISCEEQLPDEDQEEAEQEEDEVVRDVARADELDEDVDREESQEDDAGEREPHAEPPHARAGEQLTQPPERNCERDEPGGAEPGVDAVRNVVAEDELATLAREDQPARIAATPVRKRDDIAGPGYVFPVSC